MPLSKRYILNVVPVDSLVSLLIELLLLVRLFFVYRPHYISYPILTTMIANSLLTGVSDTFAQMMTIIQDRHRNMDRDKEARLEAIREEYDLPVGLEMMKGAERAVDFERLARFICYGFLAAVVQFKWFAWLDESFPIAGHSALFKRLLADQLFYAPFSLLQFFAFMNLLEGNSFNDLKKRLQKQ